MEGNDLVLKRFVDEIYSDIHPKSFSHNPFDEALSSILTEQKLCRKKATDKLPSWVKSHCLFAAVPLEQATSERVAKAKAQLFQGKYMLSLCGGLGCDEFAFSASFENITSLDTDACLNSMVRLNYMLLGCSNTKRLDQSAEEFLSQNDVLFDVIYSDPDRRAGGNRVAADARQYSPNIFELFRQHRKKGKHWLTKLSPMTDLTWIRRQFDASCRIYVFTYKNEIKELLVETGPDTCNENIIAAVQHDGACTLMGLQNLAPMATEESEIFCELSPAAIKAGFGPNIAEMSGWKGENSGTFFTGKTRVNPSLGRCFKLEQRLLGSLSEMASQIKQMGIGRSNITCREFTADSDAVRKKLKLQDGGDYYLFFTGKDKCKKGFVCSKLG